MNVAELAEELGLPPSAVLEQCKRAGIDATWAGADLSGSDVVILRSELASADAPLDLTPADEPSDGPGEPPGAVEPPVDAGPDGVDEPGAEAPSSPAPPPTAVASMPEAAGAPDAAPEPSPAAPRPGGSGPIAPPSVASVAVKPPSERRQTERRLDTAVRGGIIALAVAVVAVVAAELVANPWAIWGLWLLGGIAALVALWNGNAGRRHVTTHPERYKGLAASVVTMVLAVAVVIGIGASVAAAVGDDPAADAPLGDRDSVAEARWGYQRLTRIADEGWKRPAKDAGSCWAIDDDIQRDTDRVEVGTDQVDCDAPHTVQILEVYAFDRTADAPYPGFDELQQDAKERCSKEAEALLSPEDGDPIDGVLIGEVPTEEGWADADRDVACAVVTPTRTKPLG